MKAIYYYNKGFEFARLNTVVLFPKQSDSWQRKAWIKGYKAGQVYIQSEALLEGFDNAWDYQSKLIKDMIK